VAKTTSGFNSDHTKRQYAYGLLLESQFYHPMPIAGLYGQKQGKNGRLGGRSGETGSRNMAATPKINFLTLVFYSLLQKVFHYDVLFRHNTKRHRPQKTDRQTDDRQTTQCAKGTTDYGRPKIISEPVELVSKATPAHLSAF